MRNFKDRKFQNEKGQLTIFLGVVLMVTITMMAFIINVGLFVKAKINLQNAVDAGAWAGASVQSRQLTKIAYLNWEMRNTYKEYMFKYYVLGVLGLRDQLQSPTSDRMNFRLEPFFDSTDPSAASLGNEAIDPHNIPSVCIHFGSENNICKIYDVPGIPRFNTVGLPSITPMQESFLNTIVEVKSANCSKRSDINFGVAMVWAYGTGANVFKDIPQIAAQRIGAWPQAFELAMRVRNMEFLVNTPPADQPLCMPDSKGACLKIDQLNGEDTSSIDPPFPKHERSIKALVSAFKNLGGGKLKTTNGGDDQNVFSESFKLTELRPTKVTVDRSSLSGFLINPSAYGGVIDKYYLDLKVWPINLTTFYTTFVPTNSNVAGVAAEGTCKGSKTALPLPAYLTGFTKNPEVITYYAVKGEANFVGMFYPFADDEGIPLSAYSAAKAFGGRIGPKLFHSNNNQTVFARTDSISRKSGPYISSMVIPTGQPFDSGKVIPFSEEYFAQNGDAIGGVPGTGTDVRFVVPNLLYTNANLGVQSAGDIQELTDANGDRGKLASPDETLGLYSRDQFLPFIANLETPADSVMSNQEIAVAMSKVRGPTTYETANYLIPSAPKYDNGDRFSNPHPVQVDAFGGTTVDEYNLFAPLLGPRTLYPTDSEAISVINEFLADNESSINSYLEALFEVAQKMRTEAASNRGGADSYRAAAASIHPSTTGGTSDLDLPADCLNLSVAQKFNHFFKADATDCDIIPLKEMMRAYINGASAGVATQFKTFYRSSYINTMVDNKAIMSAYAPDELYSGKAATNKRISLLDGQEEEEFVLRNFYSTKFISINSVRVGGSGYHNTSDAKSIFSEASIFSQNQSDVFPGGGAGTGGNPLETDLIDEFKRGGQFDY